MILPKQTNKNGLVEVYIEITKRQVWDDGTEERKFRRVPCDIKIYPKEWSQSKEEVKKTNIGYYQLNTKISAKHIKVDSYINNLENADYRQGLEEELTSLAGFFPSAKKVKRNSIVEYLEEYVKYRKSTGSKRTTYKEFVTVQNRMKKFQEDTNTFYQFKDINLTFSDNLKIWMMEEEFHPNTVYKHFGTFGTFMNHYYERQHDAPDNPYVPDDFRKKEFGKISTYDSPPLPLTEKEFKILIQSNIKSERLNKTKDRFIFGCTTGLRYSDLFRVTKEHIKDDCIVLEPSKTTGTKKKNTVIIDLNAHSRSILEKYDYDMTQLKITNQYYNKEIQKLFRVLKIKNLEIVKYYKGNESSEERIEKCDLLTSHNARDTFISNSIQLGIDIPTIMSWTGHRKYDTMRKYIKLDEKHRSEMMNLWNNNIK